VQYSYFVYLRDAMVWKLDTFEAVIGGGGIHIEAMVM